MYEGLRLTELHEEWAWRVAAADGKDLEGDRTGAGKARYHARKLDAEIRRRVEELRVSGPKGLCGLAFFTGRMPMLQYGITDSLRSYPGRYDHWSYHERHAVLVPTCHLCQSKKESPQ